MIKLTIPNVLFFLAAVLCLLGVAAHELLGAPMVLGPLEASGLEDEVIWLHHFSWHVGTVAVIAMVAMYLLAIWHPAGAIFAVIASLMSAGFAALAISLAVFGSPVMWSTPAPYPWTVVAILGFAGTLVGSSSLTGNTGAH
jgi:hypothetical protein